MIPYRLYFMDNIQTMTNVANMTQKMPGKPAANGKKDIILSAVFLLLCLMIWLLPTGFEKKVDQRAIRCKGQVAAVDNQNVIQHGMVKTGEQKVVVEIKSGPFEGRTFKTENQLLGQMDRDKIFAPGDMAFVVLTLDTDGNVVFVNPQEHYRIGIEIFLLCLFALLLIAFGGVTGLKALLSFLFAALVIWKILIPSLLKGWDPILVTLGVTATLCGAIIFLVAGVNRKGATAFAGSFAGVLTSCGLAYFFHRPPSSSRGGDVLCRNAAVFGVRASGPYQNIYCSRFYRLFRCSDGPGRGRGRKHERSRGKISRHHPGRADQIGPERGPGRGWHHDHHPSSGLFRGIHHPVNGVYGAGDSFVVNV